jgi:hypothetical protein
LLSPIFRLFLKDLNQRNRYRNLIFDGVLKTRLNRDRIEHQSMNTKQ